MNEFELDEEIEVSNRRDFFESEIGYFMFDSRQSKYPTSCHRTIRVLLKSGAVVCFEYARKIEPKVTVILYGEGSTAQTRQIPQSLADKILAREV